MAQRYWDTVLRQVHRLMAADSPNAASDRHLLRQFVEKGDQTAFATLVERHGPMVFGVCRRMLHDAQEAEDALQATFCILARKAASSAWHDSIAGWLYAVARRVASRSKARTLRKRQLEQKAAAMRPDIEPEPRDSEALALLEKELQQLPEKYRAPIVLCHLEGRTNEEAAQELGWPKGTVQGRLARGREMLKSRMLRRGATVASVALAALDAGIARAALPGQLAGSTVQVSLDYMTRAPGASVPAAVTTLAEGVIRSMWLSKLKVALLIVVSVVVLGGVGVWASEHRSKSVAAVNPVVDKKEEPRPADEVDQFKAYLAKNHKGAKWQTGPARIDGEAIRTAFPGQRFYYVASSPPLPPGAFNPEVFEAFRKRSEEYRNGNYISLTVATDGKRDFVPVDFNKGFNGGMMKIASDDDARIAAAAIFAIANPGSVPVAKNLQVTKSKEGWTCSLRIFAGNDTVRFNVEGKCVGVSRVAPPILPPSAGPGPRLPVPPK